jgi:ATP-binding cassette, subfamily C, bacterial LapB
VAWSDLEAAYTGKAILVKPRANPAQLDGQRAAAAKGHWFWGVIRLLWPTYAQVIVAAALINILALASPLFIMNVYDRVLPNKAIPTLWVLALGIGLAILFDLVLRSLRGRLIDGAGRRADVVLASRIFEHVLGLKFASRPATTGSFANRLADFEQVREFFTSGTLATLTDVAFFGLFFLVIYMVAGPLAYIPAVAAALVVVIGLVLQFPLRRAARASAMDAAQRHSLLVESIAALETVKSLRAEGRLQRHWEDLVGRTSRTFETARGYSSAIQNSTFAVQQLVTVAIVIGGTYMFDQGDITMGGIIAAVILSGRCVAPFGQFSTLIARSQQSFAALGGARRDHVDGVRAARRQAVHRPADHRRQNRVPLGALHLSGRREPGHQRPRPHDRARRETRASSARSAPARRRSAACCAGSTTSARARCSSTASIFASSIPTRCAAPSASSARMPTCSSAPCATTSAWARPAPATRMSCAPAGWPASTISRSGIRKATTCRSASAAARCRAASARR